MLAKAAVAVAPFEKTGDFKTGLTIVTRVLMVIMRKIGKLT